MTSARKPPRILIVEPSAKTRQTLVTLFQKAGFQTLATGSGKEALVIAWRDRPHLIVVDPRLPDLSGVEFVKRLRSDRRTEQTPILAFAAQPRSDQMLACLDAGCTHFLPKRKENLKPLFNLVVQELQKQRQAAEARGVLVVFSAAKGGVGTSSLCINVMAALAFEHHGQKMAVVDFSLPLGDLLQITAPRNPKPFSVVEATHTPAHKLTPAFFAEHLSTADGWGFDLLPAPPTPKEAQAVNPKGVPALIEGLLQCYDVVCVDVGRSLSRISLPILQRAHQIVVVLAPDFVTVTKTQTVLRYLLEQNIQRNRLFPILNRPSELKGLARPEVESRLELPIASALMYLGEHLSLTHSEHTPLIVKYPDDASALTIRQMARELYHQAGEVRTFLRQNPTATSGSLL